MSVDHIRYDLLTQQALRAVVRRVLGDVAKVGALPGEHHFYITFDTRAPGVKISSRLREQYPEEMTIVLQHQFWDLTVTDVYVEVGLSFNGITEKLHVPLEAIKGFFDPSVQFGLQFETAGEVPKVVTEKPTLTAVPDDAKDARPRRKSAPSAQPGPESAQGNIKDAVKPAPVAVVSDSDKDPDKPSGGAEVVRLDRFRKK
jgi:uncharacterized protein